MSFTILPYTEVDGIRTAADSDIKKLFNRTNEDGLLPVVFYEGTIKTACDFLAMAKSKAAFFYILIDGTETVGYTWLNRFENHTARIHFCFFKEYWGKAEDFAKYVLERFTNMTGKEGDILFDLLTGFVPEWNTHAIKFALRCGAHTHGVIPNAIYNKALGKSENAVFLYYLKREAS